jgi:hypothetical protein
MLCEITDKYKGLRSARKVTDCGKDLAKHNSPDGKSAEHRLTT